MDQETKQWLDFAVQDLGVAQHLFDTYYPKPLEIICYHCQQAAEKALKAVIIANGCPGGLPKVHDLSFLLGRMKNYVQIDDLYYDCADALTPYGVSVRYPNELSLEERHATEAIKQARTILDWVKTLIS
jgi:HEPN domain-containing protein